MNKEIGRPTVITELTLQKLRDGFCMGLTDIECSLFAGIAVSTLYNYCRENPDFTEEKELLKNQPKIKAKMNLDKAIKEEDRDISKWYLERKSKDEFSLKQEVNSNINASVTITEEDKKLLDNLTERLK